ncbi:riboflavin synthase [Paenibacillus yanchengensis]|uniref:Riboflavin synthase n=1 Tax=Paenibacillus yanchengensis TaxID=2035833 RepID=A0ABW4YJV1_9BACL
MFTGLVEEVGHLRFVKSAGQSLYLTIAAKKVLSDVQIGDSIAVNGVCLTVTNYTGNSFTADVMPETFRSTTLHQLKPGDELNLERAMSAQGRFGGHIVQGHVDGVGQIAAKISEGNAIVFTIRPADERVLKYIVPKGSITIDGISLTVVSTTKQQFTVSIIPHTMSETVLLTRDIGDDVNLECDIIGKYVEHLLSFSVEESKNNQQKSKLTASYLSEHGFM